MLGREHEVVAQLVGGEHEVRHLLPDLRVRHVRVARPRSCSKYRSQSGGTVGWVTIPVSSVLIGEPSVVRPCGERTILRSRTKKSNL